MLDAVVDINIAQIERVRPVTAIQNGGNMIGDEEAERWRKVVCCTHCRVKLTEGDVTTIVR